MRPARALAGLVLLLAAVARPAIAQEATGAPRQVAIRVVTAPEGAPLGYAIVAAPQLGVERFTSASGATVLAVPAAGPLRLRVKRLGFTPADTTILVSDAPSQAVTIALPRVTFRLTAVRVLDWPPCERPGLAEADVQVRGIVEQLRENAERYRLLVRTYPFVYTMRREFGELAPDGSYIARSSSVLPLEGKPEWSYRPGTLIAREGAGPGARGEWVMRIPTISDLAEESFIASHCFHVAGLEEKDGAQLLRLDLVAADTLRSVDVHAAAWLDPVDYQLRHASFTLTRPPTQVRGVVSFTTRVRYRELLPFVPVMQLTVAENTVREGRNRTRVLVERQTFQQVLFQGARPDSLLGAVPP